MDQRFLSCLLLSLTAPSVFTGCRACSHSSALAALEAKQGQVQRNVAVTASVWLEATIGVGFEAGDAVRTAHASNALLGLDDGSKLRVQQDSVVRFLKRLPSGKAQGIDVETGQALLEAGDHELQLTTGIGVARIEANSRVLIRRTQGSMQFEVSVGKARFEDSEGSHDVEPGHSYFVNVGNAVVEAASFPDAGLRPNISSGEPKAAGEQKRGEAAEVSAQVTGTGVSQKDPNAGTFRALAIGPTRIRLGATVRVEVGSSVELESGSAKVLLSGAGSYNVRSDTEALVEMQVGSMSVTGATRLIVPGGTIETTENSAATLDALGKGRTRLRVTRGQASFGGGKSPTKVSAGEEAILNPDGSGKLEGRGLDYADIIVDAGETVVVHDPKPPTAVRFQFGSHCAGGGTIRVLGHATGQFASGANSAALAFGPGRHAYALFCSPDPVSSKTPIASGTLTVLRDSGTRPVPTKPPSTTVNIDGRNYTVMYQNQLPNLTVVWPNAPSVSNFTLHVESRDGTKSFVSSAPSYAFRSGAIPEGHHTIFFEGGNRVSRHTGIQIAFDNAAPKASLLTPVEPDVGAAGDVTISGMAQPGWQIEIGGNKVPQDAQQRFSQRLQVPNGERALAVRLSHPTRGVHVYLRRVARSHE